VHALHPRGFLHQNAFHEVDTYSSPKKQYLMLKTILSYYDKSLAALQADAPFSKLAGLPVREKIGRFKYAPETEIDARYEEIAKELGEQVRALTEGGEAHA